MTAKTTPDSSRAVVAQTQSPFLPGPGHHYPCPLGYSPSAAPAPHSHPLSVCPTWVPPSVVPAVLFLPSPPLCISAPWMPSGLSAQAVWLMCMLYPAPPFRDPGQGNKGNEAWFPCVSDGDAGHTHHSWSREKGQRCAGSTRKVLLPPGLTQPPPQGRPSQSAVPLLLWHLWAQALAPWVDSVLL